MRSNPRAQLTGADRHVLNQYGKHGNFVNIFISYAGERRSVADSIAVRLRGEGHTVFFDKDSLPPADSYDASIRQAITDCDLFIFLISLESVTPGSYALTELGLARDKWRSPIRHVLPVQVSHTTMDQIPAYLKAVTILMPQGDPVAEVLAAVARIQRSPSFIRTVWASGITVVIAILVAIIFLPPPKPSAPEPCRLSITLHAPNLSDENHPRALIKTEGMTHAFLLSHQGNNPVDVTLQTGAPWTLGVLDDEKELLQPVDMLGCPTSPMERNFDGDIQLSIRPR